MTTFYLFKTNSGIVYDRTKGKNQRLYFDAKYILRSHEGSFIIKQGDGMNAILERYDKNNNLVYTKDLNETGMYVCGPVYAKLSKKTNKFMKDIEQYLVSTVGREYFSLNLKKDSVLPFKIQLKAWQDGALRHSFYVNIDENKLDENTVNAIIRRFDELKKLDLNRFLMHYMAYTNHATTFTINDGFFDVAKGLGIAVREVPFQRTGS